MNKRLSGKKMELYDRPDYYDVAFSFRNIKHEVDFLEKVIKKFSGIPVRTIFELAAGNSPYMEEVAGRGYRYVGLELNKKMIAFSKEKAARRSIRARFICGDMKNFLMTTKVDLACVLLGSLYVNSDSDLIHHLKSAGKVLKPGALYILDGVVEFFPGQIKRQSWTMKDKNIIVKTIFIPQVIDDVENLYDEKIILQVTKDGKTFLVEQDEIKKRFNKKDFLAIVKKEGSFQYIGSFANFNIGQKPRKNARNILVLRKKPKNHG
jgi:SAM-dependent methyltransferase